MRCEAMPPVLRGCATAILIGACAAALAQPTPKVVRDNGKCRLAVPADWTVPAPGIGLAQAPGGNASAAVQTDDVNSWSELKATVTKLLKPTAIEEDGATRFAFTYGGAGTHRYLAKRFAGFQCVAQLDLNDAAAVRRYGADAARILDSLDRAP